MKIDKIYYINLDKRKERKEFMEDQLSDINIPYERFSAICPTEEDLSGQYKFFYERMENWRKAGNKSQFKVLGTLGCYLSHYFIQKKALESQHGNYLVLEDDWNVNPECIFEINRLFSEGLVGYDWDIFGSFWSSHQKIVIKHKGSTFPSKFYNKRKSQPMGGAHFILYNKLSTSKIINFLDVENVFNIDGVLCNDMLNIYHMKMPIKNHGFQTDIQA